MLHEGGRCELDIAVPLELGLIKMGLGQEAFSKENNMVREGAEVEMWAIFRNLLSLVPFLKVLR